MRIDSGTIGMESARSYKASNVTVRRFKITEYDASSAQGATEQNGNTLNAAVSGEEETTKEQTSQTTDQNTVSFGGWQSRFGIATSRISLRTTRSDTLNDIRQLTIRFIFDMLFAARRHRWNEWTQNSQTSELKYNVETNIIGENLQDASSIQSESIVQGDKALFVTQMKMLSYSMESWYKETEDTSFSTVGTVRTKDGRELHFNVNVGMSREFQQYYQEDLELASFKMCDPLVINLDTDVAELSEQNFYFDIDGDGETESIAQLSEGSGYLALDRNQDGSINDGSELFGTVSGNGFADLAKYDQDGNGWIDEGDAIWSKLKIWCKDENGKDVLYRLADKGVGAICLQNASTDFILKGDDGHTKGAIRNTGIFLYENGNVGTVQHVDVAKYQSKA